MTKIDQNAERPGKVIKYSGGNYVLVSILGDGSYATVWMCYDVEKKDLFAMKIFYDNKEAKKEIAVYEKLKKHGIDQDTVKLHRVITHENKTCAVFDLMAGSLYDIMKHGKIKETNATFSSGFPVDFVIKVLYDVLVVLNNLHSNKIVHGDVKPENILVYGRTTINTELINSLNPKTSIKKISEHIKDVCKKYNVRTYVSDSESESTETESSDSDSEFEDDQSIPPKKIVLSDDESDDFEDHQTIDSNDSAYLAELADFENLSKSIEHYEDKCSLELLETCFDNPIIKLSDMGTCVFDEKKPIGVQTKYYKSPEIIIGLNYDASSDIWALGCTIYELLTGKILINPDAYDIDKKRCMLHIIYSYIGTIPDSMIDNSPFKQVFFTETYNLKENAVYYEQTDQNDNNKNIWQNLLDNLECTEIKKYLLLNLILDMLEIDPSKRITAEKALTNELFKNY